MAARITLSITDTTPADFARSLRSLASKVAIEDLTPGADLTVGNVRVQVQTPQESPIRAFARANGFEVGGRGRYSKALTEAYAAHQKEERKAARAAAAARKAERDAARAAAESVTA